MRLQLAPFRPPAAEPLPMGSSIRMPALLWPGCIFLLLLLLLFGAGVDGRPEPSLAGAGLEYHIVRLPDEPLPTEELESFLNELGRDGWRLPDTVEVRSFWNEETEETVYRLLRNSAEPTKSDGVHTHVILSRSVNH